MIISRKTFKKSKLKGNSEIVGVISIDNEKYAIVNNYDKQRIEHFAISDKEAREIIKLL